ncbi:IS3 family transposase [Luteibacter yeojuensis]|uniref:IS3 family transposase n=1 Tax=Luteibacter yeojuensis TaxID=345309 RepID=A0A7X5QRA5_9GAMM|nr:IS3 family transposase [Luteibacter yeojuensis]
MSAPPGDPDLVQEIRQAVAHLPSYGYRRAWALLRRDREARDALPVNRKRVYRIMRTHGLMLVRSSAWPRRSRRHEGRVAVDTSNQRWCSNGFEFRCDKGESVRGTFALDCCDREALSWAATTGGQTGDIMRDVMLAAVEKRFGATLPDRPIERLTDNGSLYIAHQTRAFARQIELDPLTTPVCSPQSNGMAGSFVRTLKRDYIAHMPKPDAPTAMRHLEEVFEHYNEHHPHSALNYRSPREFRRRVGSSP